ncbi:Predicted dinucleotide-utilizing enzyme [Raoultella terrigena]|uniref:Predicted dinucleotide-utilizing enzyme n=1 Tax=Raoultella terrigena TaxID=577 RepID=A0A485CHN4_RAOTE|nr:Predicted dinucleotide-utilizing enzyme [Raoultella terrigena]
MSEMITVGEAIARTLEQYNVEAIYGVISIHNLPIADAVGQRGNIALFRRAVRPDRSPWPTPTGAFPDWAWR